MLEEVHDASIYMQDEDMRVPQSAKTNWEEVEYYRTGMEEIDMQRNRMIDANGW